KTPEQLKYEFAAIMANGGIINVGDQVMIDGRLQSGAYDVIGEAFAFLAPELQALPEQAFDALLAAPELEPWRVRLARLRRLKPHTLSPGEERILALGAPAVAAQGEIFSQLTNVDMDFGEVEDEDGSRKKVTQSTLSSFLQRRDRRVRREAFHAFYREIGAHRYTLAAALAGSVRGDVFHARARNYPSALESALFPDNVPPAVYDQLIAAVRSRLPDLQRYYALRRRLLELEDIHFYDTYVPLVPDARVRTPWDDACRLVIEAVAPLGEEYTRVLSDGLGSGRWCDRFENKGKRSGAFSYGTYEGPPYILMNYKEDVFADVYTLAHEAGHSMHTWFSRRVQNFQNYHYPIFLAEVASTFNEMLLTEHLLNKTTDSRMRAYIINRQVDDIRGTMFRQTMFAEFEKAIHEAEESGAGLTLEAFRKIYRGLLEAYFGPDFSLDEELELEGLRIPHFYHAFYVYKYATGLAAAVALATRVIETGDAAAYLRFLASGGSKFPIETLAEAGVDMLTPAPVLAALDLFSRRVDELEELLG
ncbi:MAG: oligoendopeptidase F, partial [Terrimicrobiaceae bacterium]|nr:oligoendopeptidase F [Terrimicrobiaceae bacterium]